MLSQQELNQIFDAYMKKYSEESNIDLSYFIAPEDREDIIECALEYLKKSKTLSNLRQEYTANMKSHNTQKYGLASSVLIGVIGALTGIVQDRAFAPTVYKFMAAYALGLNIGGLYGMTREVNDEVLKKLHSDVTYEAKMFMDGAMQLLVSKIELTFRSETEKKLLNKKWKKNKSKLLMNIR